MSSGSPPVLRPLSALRTFSACFPRQVLAVVALLLGYVVAVDALCSQIPRWIQHTQAHPDWLHKAAGGLLAAARQRLAGGT